MACNLPREMHCEIDYHEWDDSDISVLGSHTDLE